MSHIHAAPAKNASTIVRHGSRIAAILALLLGMVVPAFAQTAVVMPEPKIQFFDNNGDPLNGGKLFSYLPGTTTPFETCSSSVLVAGACSVANANPVILDTAGRASVFLRPAVYKFILQTSAGVQIWSADNITSTQFLGTGTASTGTFLRGDYAWSRLTTVVTTTATGTQNNFDPGIVGNTTILANNAALLTITGFSPAIAPWDGQQVWVLSKGAGEVDLPHQNASSTAAFRLLNVATSGVTPLAGLTGSALYVYDASTARWRLMFHEQGAWITPTYAAGTYTANGAMTWTVGSGDVTTLAYRLSGRTVAVLFSIDTTTVAGVVSTQLQITIPGGFTSAAKRTAAGIFYSDSAAAFTGGSVQVSPTSTLLELFRAATANWTAAVDTTSVRGQIAFEVN